MWYAGVNLEINNRNIFSTSDIISLLCKVYVLEEFLKKNKIKFEGPLPMHH